MWDTYGLGLARLMAAGAIPIVSRSLSSGGCNGRHLCQLDGDLVVSDGPPVHGVDGTLGLGWSGHGDEGVTKLGCGASVRRDRDPLTITARQRCMT